MEAIVYDNKFNIVNVIDDYQSMIWTERYSELGDFELYGAINSKLASCSLGNIVRAPGTRRAMIIESINYDLGADTNKLLVSGRSLESILYRRIIWDQTIVGGGLQDAIYSLLYTNVINPSDPNRKLPLIFERSTDPLITDCSFSSAQFTGDTVYDAVKALCDAFEVGFKIEMDDSNQFIFNLYAGQNRSFTQERNPYVIYSEDFDNILSGTFKNTIQKYSNVALVAGEGEGSERRKLSCTNESTEPSGMDRYEMFVDARDISSTTDEGTLTDDEYNAQLQERGTQKLEEVEMDYTFDAQIDTVNSYIFGKDYYLGDVLQVISTIARIDAQIRITEFIRSCENGQYNAYPQFKVIALGEYEDYLQHPLEAQNGDVIYAQNGEALFIDF